MLGVAASVQEVLQDGFSIPGDQIVDRLSFSADGQLLAVASLVRASPAITFIQSTRSIVCGVLRGYYRVFHCKIVLDPFLRHFVRCWWPLVSAVHSSSADTCMR